MGKYLRRAKTTGDFTFMEVSPNSFCGVRTRAKTLALQRLQNSSISSDESFCFLELRSRRLEKFMPPAIKPKEICKENGILNPNPRSEFGMKEGGKLVRVSRGFELETCPVSINYDLGTVQKDLVKDDEVEIEVSFGENVLEVEEFSRNVRETTPTSLIRNSEDIGSPASSTRPSYSTNTNGRSSVHRNIPTTIEMEEFFKGVEQPQLKLFTEKYNYDPVNDCPLPGRYEWIKLE